MLLFPLSLSLSLSLFYDGEGQKNRNVGPAAENARSEPREARERKTMQRSLSFFFSSLCVRLD